MENNVGVIIGKRLSELFSRIDVRQKDLAEYLDVCPNMISYFKNGSRVPSTEQMIMIADFFGVSLDYLTGRSDTVCINPEKQFVCDYLDMPEQAVDRFLEWKDYWIVSGEDGYVLYSMDFDRFFTNFVSKYAKEAKNEVFTSELVYDLVIIRLFEKILQKVKDELQIFYQSKDSFENASLYKRDKLALCMKMAIDFDKLKYSRYHQAQRLLMDFLHTNETKIHEAINSRQYCAKKILEIEKTSPRNDYPKRGPFLGILRLNDIESIADWVLTIGDNGEQLDEKLRKAGVNDQYEREMFIRKIFSFIKQRKEHNINGDD